MKDYSDLLLFLGALGFCLLLLIIAVGQFDRYRTKRPYLTARWDDKTSDWVNEEEHDVGPDGLRLQEDLAAHLKAYAAAVIDLYEPATTDHQGDPK